MLISGSTWQGLTTTGYSGYYSITYRNIWYLGTGKPEIRIYTHGDNIRVKPELSDTYTHSHSFTTNGIQTYNYTFSPSLDGDLGKAMMIFQAAKTYSDYAVLYSNFNSIPFCDIIYSALQNESHYSNNCIYLVNCPNEYNCPKTYAAWDVIGHEYAHHVQHEIGITYYHLENSVIGSNLIDEFYDEYQNPQGTNTNALPDAKETGQKLAWIEGMATYWSIVMQSHFNNDLKSISTVGNSSFDTEKGSFDVDDSNFDLSGDADMLAIFSFLYKLYSTEINDNDFFSLGDEIIWDLIIMNKPQTFYDFINSLYDYGCNKDQIALLFEYYNVINNDLRVIDYYYDSLPVFTWSNKTGSNVINFNKFDLYIKDLSNNTIIHRVINSTGDTTSLRLSVSDWHTIYNRPGNEIKVSYIAWKTTSYISGGYYSETLVLPKPNSFKNKRQIKPNEWGFDNNYYFENDLIAHPELQCTNLNGISTDRLRCGYVDSYIVLSSRRQNAGSAYLEPNFTGPYFSFLYSACLWSNNELIDGSALIEVKVLGESWITAVDLLNDVTLPIKGGGLLRRVYRNNNGIMGIRFIVTSSAIGNEDKGKLCIDDLVLSRNGNQYSDPYYITNYPKTTN